MKRSAIYKVNTRITAIALVLCMLMVAACNTAFGQAKFYATAPKAIGINQGLQLSFTLENANGNNLKLPAMPDFQLISGPNTSTSMQWVNGNVSQSVTYTYVYKPKKEGTFKIGKASVQVSGTTMESNELTVEVGKAVQQQQQRQRNPYDPFDDPFFNPQRGQQQPEVSKADLEKQAKDDVFMRLVISKASAYKGEMITASYRLYFRQSLEGINVTKAPAFDGFWSQEVELDPKRRPVPETYNGKQYNTVDIIKYNLYPQRAGALTIAGAEVETVVQIPVAGRTRSAFDYFTGGGIQQLPLTLRMNPAAVTVKELPDAGKPENFSGVVGKFDYQTRLSSVEAKTDEPVTYSVKITGTGNLKFVEPPVMSFPESFEVYDPKVKENITNGAAGLTGSKQYDYLLIPRQPGEYTIEVQPFSYFDPSSAKYFTLKSSEFTVKVTGEASKNVNADTNAVAQKEVSLLGQDIRYIKTTAPELNKGNTFFASAGYVGAFAAPFLLFVGLIAVKRRNEDLAADIVGTKRRRALKLAKKRLSVAEKHLAKNNKHDFYTEVSRGMWGYLSDKLNIDMASLSKDNVEDKLLAKQVNPDTITKLKYLISVCELALYAPVGEGGEMKQNYEAALNLIADLEDEIK